jgi:hypothetical protein
LPWSTWATMLRFRMRSSCNKVLEKEGPVAPAKPRVHYKCGPRRPPAGSAT